MLAALSLQGGDTLEGAEEILLRATVAGLLNSKKLNHYPLTTSQIISSVNAAIASHNRATIISLATTIDNDNNSGCPLN